MSKVLVTMVLTLTTVVGIGWFAYRQGEMAGLDACPPCTKAEPLREIKRVLRKTLYLVTVQDNRLVEVPFAVPPRGAVRQFLGRLYEKLAGWQGGANAHITFRFSVNFTYGFDLGQGFDLVEKDGGLEFHAPPIRMVTCPAINMGSLTARVEDSSYLVSEDREKVEIQRTLTEYALKQGEDSLRDAGERNQIKSRAEEQLKGFLVSLADSYGMKVTPDQVKVIYKDGKDYDAAAWNADDPASIRAKLEKYHCE